MKGIELPRINKSIEKLLLKSQILVNNFVGNALIQNKMSTFNITLEKVNSFQSDVNTARDVYYRQIGKYSERSVASNEFKQQWRNARKVHFNDIKLSRSALRQFPNDAELLGLNDAREKNLSEWLGQSRRFYETAQEHPGMIEKLAAYGLDQARLTAGLQEINNTEAAYAKYQDFRGASQQATQDRDQLVEAIARERQKILTVAEVALQDKPELLEQLGH